MKKVLWLSTAILSLAIAAFSAQGCFGRAPDTDTGNKKAEGEGEGATEGEGEGEGIAEGEGEEEGMEEGE